MNTLMWCQQTINNNNDDAPRPSMAPQAPRARGAVPITYSDQAIVAPIARPVQRIGGDVNSARAPIAHPFKRIGGDDVNFARSPVFLSLIILAVVLVCGPLLGSF